MSKIKAECVSGCDSNDIKGNLPSNDPGGWIRISSLNPGTLYEVKIVKALFSDFYAPKIVNFTFNFTTGAKSFLKKNVSLQK